VEYLGTYPKDEQLVFDRQYEAFFNSQPQGIENPATFAIAQRHQKQLGAAQKRSLSERLKLPGM
jgi:hypothetical protein